MNHGGSWNFDFGKLKYVNAIHSSSFPTAVGNPGGLSLKASIKYLHCGRYSADNGYETHSDAY
jgi:hypothetical protein